MQVLWNSKVKYVSVSQLSGLDLVIPLWVCLWTFYMSSSYCLTLGKKRKLKGIFLKRKRNMSPPFYFKPAKVGLLVFLDATA